MTPYLEVTSDRIRLRLLNASIARVYNFGFWDDREFDLVVTDGGPLAEPPYKAPTNRVAGMLRDLLMPLAFRFS